MARISVNTAAVRRLDRDPAVLRQVQAVAEEAADRIEARAPKRTGGGARSVHSEPDPTQPGFRVGWDRQHFYLSFAELGTEDQPARPFARPVADEINRSRS